MTQQNDPSRIQPDSRSTQKIDTFGLIGAAVILLAFIAAWEVLVRLLSVPEYLIPSPSRIISTMMERRDLLSVDFGVTLIEAVLGFLMANLLSLIVGVIFFYSRTVERAVLPLLVGLKSIPLVALAPLLVLWFGYGLSSKAVMAALVAFFPMVIGFNAGIRSVSSDSYDLMRSLNATRWEMLTKLCVPSAIPHMLAALKVSATLAVVGAIVAELMGAKSGLGFTILMASYNVDTPLLFCAIVLSALCGAILYGTVIGLELFLNRYRLGHADVHQAQ